MTDRRIPKNIIRFWHDATRVPSPIDAAIQRSAARHPDYRLLLVDDAYMIPFIEARYGAPAARLYERNQIPASRADIARVMLLLEHGGVYLDAELELMEHLDTLIEPATELWLLRWGDAYHNCTIGAVPGHPILRRTVEVMLRGESSRSRPMQSE